MMIGLPNNWYDGKGEIARVCCQRNRRIHTEIEVATAAGSHGGRSLPPDVTEFPEENRRRGGRGSLEVCRSAQIA